MSRDQRRSIKLIQPRLQLRLILSFFAISLLALLLQLLLFVCSLAELASELPVEGPLVLERIAPHVISIFLFTVAALVPLTLIVGILLTFRIAGPLYHFEKFLGQVIRGEKPADCRLRKGDQLLEFCDLLNRATAPLRGRDEDAPPAPSEAQIPGDEPAPSRERAA